MFFLMIIRTPSCSGAGVQEGGTWLAALALVVGRCCISSFELAALLRLAAFGETRNEPSLLRRTLSVAAIPLLVHQVLVAQRRRYEHD